MQTKSIKVQCPAKINLNLKVINKRDDGFHNIESVMQTISLYDYLSISVDDSEKLEIILDGNNKEIPYNEKNLVYKAGILFCETCKISNKKISVYIDKNIPVAAGLAGGSTDAAGMLYGLNKLFGEVLAEQDLHKLCAQLGSDLNFCLVGGCMKTSGRGEILEPCDFKPSKVNLIKPRDLGISAKEAYTKFSSKIRLNSTDRDKYKNDLEWAVIDDYKELQFIKEKYPTSMMTGSGSTYFSLDKEFEQSEGYWINNGLSFVNNGTSQV